MDMINNVATKKFIAEHINDDISVLALSANKYPDVDILYAINQIKGKRSIQHKIPSWYKNQEIIFPVHLSVEQCSSEITASFKSSLLQGETLVDLTGGFGVDTAFLSSNFKKVAYVERNADLCQIAEHNFSVLGCSNIHVFNSDAVDYLNKMDNVDCIFIDPARRSATGKKTVVFSDCEPNIVDLLPILLKKSKSILIKTSPMLDITKALSELKNVNSVYVLSVENECKELLFLLNERQNQTEISCLNFLKNNLCQHFSFTNEEEQNSACLYTNVPGIYLYEPNTSILKAGAFKTLSSRFNLKKLHPNSHLYTSNILCADFPGRIFFIDACFSFNNQQIKTHLSDIKKANITVRNFPDTVESLRKRLKLSDGGDVYLFATTLSDNKKVILNCHKV